MRPKICLGEQSQHPESQRPRASSRSRNNYARGAAYERAVRKVYEARGFYVVRSAGSKGIVDLVALPGRSAPASETRVVLIQVKAGRRGATPGEVAALRMLARSLRVDADYEVVERPRPRGRTR